MFLSLILFTRDFPVASASLIGNRFLFTCCFHQVNVGPKYSVLGFPSEITV